MLVIPDTNITATLSNLRYLGIKIIIDKAKVNYTHVSIVQAYTLKEIIEELDLKRDEVKIV